jgi:hypothetical protein
LGHSYSSHNFLLVPDKIWIAHAYVFPSLPRSMINLDLTIAFTYQNTVDAVLVQGDHPVQATDLVVSHSAAFDVVRRGIKLG